MDLKTNCLLCRELVHNYESTGLYAPWIEEVTISLCEVLELDKHYQHHLETAVYCDSCLFTIRDIEFTVKNIHALQKRLETSRQRVSTLLETNYDEIDSGRGESISGGNGMEENSEDESYSYDQVVTSIWDALSVEKKPVVLADANGNGTGGSIPRLSPRIPYRHKIILHQPQSISDDSDSDFYPDIQPIVKIETDFPSPRKRNRKNPTPVKVSKKSLAQRKKDLKARQNKSKEFKCKLAKCKFATNSSAKYDKHLKKHEDKSKAKKRTKDSTAEGAVDNSECSDADGDGEIQDQQSGDEDQTEAKGRRRTIKSKKPGTTKKYSSIKKFNCTVGDCKFRCDNEGRFQVHCRIHEGDETPYHCELCKEAKFTTNAALYYHLRQSCTANPERLKRKNAIRTPQKRENDRRPYYRVDSETGEDDSADENPAKDKIELTCTYEFCVFSTTSERRYQCHIRIHEGDPLPYWCNSCDKKFPKAKHLNLHKHRNCGDVITCPIASCDTVFPNRYAVKAHLSTVHYKEGKHVCQYCSKIFESIEEKQFKEHERTHEIREVEGRKFACIIGDCVSKFTNSVDLRAHVLLEHESSSSKCEICQAVLANPTSLKRHTQEQHGPPNYSLQCDKCPHIAKHPSGLRLHMNKHSEIKRYVCRIEGCGKEFTWPNGLRNHMMSHTGQKKYKCTFDGCMKAFVSSSKLRDHEETHSDRHSYFCDRCAKSFKAKKNLKQHFRYVHNVGYTSVKSARRQRLAETGEDGLSDTLGPSTTQKSKARKKSQSASKIAMTKSYEQVSEDDEDMKETNDGGGGSSGRSEMDVTLGSGGWTFPQQYTTGAHHHAQQFLNPLFHQMNNSSLYFSN